MWARSPSSWCRCRSSGTYSSCSKRKTLRPAQRSKPRRTRKNSRCVDLKRNGKQEINRRWKLRNAHVCLSCFYRCLLYHFSQDLLNHFLSGLFNLLVWLPYTCRNGMRYCDRKCYFCPLWVVLIPSITLCRKPCKHVGQNLRPCSTSRCFWRALNGLATVCRAMHEMDQDCIPYKSKGHPGHAAKVSSTSIWLFHPSSVSRHFQPKVLGHPWPPLNFKHLDGGKAFFSLHATLMPATIIEPEMLKSNASSHSVQR